MVIITKKNYPLLFKQLRIISSNHRLPANHLAVRFATAKDEKVKKKKK